MTRHYCCRGCESAQSIARYMPAIPGVRLGAGRRMRPLTEDEIREGRATRAAKQAARRANPVIGPAIKAADRRRLEAWRLANPDKVRAAIKRRQWEKNQRARLSRGVQSARHLNSRSSPTKEQWLAILKNFGTRCAYCDTPLAKPTGGKHQADNEESLDHFVPLKLGGQHDASNVVPACRKCNVAKNAKEPRAWMQDEERYQFVCDMRSLT